MAFDNDRDLLASLGEAVAGSQARNIALNHILRDLVIQIARSQDDPSKYLSSMFERVSSTLEQRETDQDMSHPVNTEIKWVLESFFSNASLAVQKR